MVSIIEASQRWEESGFKGRSAARPGHGGRLVPRFSDGPEKCAHYQNSSLSSSRASHGMSQGFSQCFLLMPIIFHAAVVTKMKEFDAGGRDLHASCTA